MYIPGAKVIYICNLEKHTLAHSERCFNKSKITQTNELFQRKIPSSIDFHKLPQLKLSL